MAEAVVGEVAWLCSARCGDVGCLVLGCCTVRTVATSVDPRTVGMGGRLRLEGVVTAVVWLRVYVANVTVELDAVIRMKRVCLGVSAVCRIGVAPCSRREQR